jgi:L-aspartate oxidase
VVARAIAREGMDGQVHLDMRAVGAVSDLKARFPGISSFLAGYGLELAKDLIPVRPAAHYMMGGVRTDLHGRTSVPGLFAAGEAACTGVHGANRLASNSLLEGLVFGALAAEAMLEEQWSVVSGKWSEKTLPRGDADVEGWIALLRRLMWRDAGLLRDKAGLRLAQAGLAALQERVPSELTRRSLEARNLLVVAEAIVQSALGREESRGAHFRLDYPERASEARRSVLRWGELRFADA